MITLGAVRALHQLRLQQTIALVGFDDIALADVLEPGITVMAQDPGRIGTIAAERVFARMDGDTSPAVTTMVPTDPARTRFGRDLPALVIESSCPGCSAPAERSDRERVARPARRVDLLKPVWWETNWWKRADGDVLMEIRRRR